MMHTTTHNECSMHISCPTNEEIQRLVHNTIEKVMKKLWIHKHEEERCTDDMEIKGRGEKTTSAADDARMKRTTQIRG